METVELIEALRRHGAGCFACGYEHNCDQSRCALMQEAAGRLGSYDVTPGNNLPILEQLRTENAQLRAVITEINPDFFKRKCRICGCDWNHPCNDHDYWVEDDLCSACARRLGKTEVP